MLIDQLDQLGHTCLSSNVLRLDLSNTLSFYLICLIDSNFDKLKILEAGTFLQISIFF